MQVERRTEDIVQGRAHSPSRRDINNEKTYYKFNYKYVNFFIFYNNL